jgi:hypothetical protein
MGVRVHDAPPVRYARSEACLILARGKAANFSDLALMMDGSVKGAASVSRHVPEPKGGQNLTRKVGNRPEGWKLVISVWSNAAPDLDFSVDTL